MRDEEVRLAMGGDNKGANRGRDDDLSDSFADLTYGGATDDWGYRPLTADVVNSPLFGVNLFVGYHGLSSATAHVDAITAEVFYCE